MTTTTRRWPAEWERQDGVLLGWPSHAEIWSAEQPLTAVQAVHATLVREISRHERVPLVSAEAEAARATCLAAGAVAERLICVPVPTNDLWARDFGPLGVLDRAAPRLLDFAYNGWGLKYRSDLDNQVTRRLAAAGTFGATPVTTLGLVMEGGSLDIDDQGRLLTTAACLLSPNRNPHLSRAEIAAELRRQLGAREVLWLDHGWLAGDDTDAHVDMLARWAPGGVILHTACDDPMDEHFAELAALAAELSALPGVTTRPLFLPRAIHAPDGRRLPASYANFLVINGAVLVPTYGEPAADHRALATIGAAFAGRAIVGIDCRPLIHQHGSLHCATMQLPAGCLA